MKEECSETHEMNEAPAALAGGNPPGGRDLRKHGGEREAINPSEGKAAPPDGGQRQSL